MTRCFVGMTVAGLIWAVAPETAQGQLHSMTVPNASMGPGLMIGGDYGRGLNDDTGKRNYFGVRVGVGLPVLSLWGGVGTVKIDESEMTFGGGAAIKVVQGPLVPVEVSLQGGVGFLSEDGGNLITVPVGVALAIDVPSPAISVKPWAMPRVQLERLSNDGGESQSEIGFGISGGLIIGAPNGIGAHATLDWMTIDSVFGNLTPLLFSIGVHYNISVPSLGMM